MGGGNARIFSNSADDVARVVLAKDGERPGHVLGMLKGKLLARFLNMTNNHDDGCDAEQE